MREQRDEGARMSEDPRLREWRSDLVGSVGLGIAYYLAAQLSLRLALVGENITPLWPPTGIALMVGVGSKVMLETTVDAAVSRLRASGTSA